MKFSLDLRESPNRMARRSSRISGLKQRLIGALISWREALKHAEKLKGRTKEDTQELISIFPRKVILMNTMRI